jgi:hypothetical protein
MDLTEILKKLEDETGIQVWQDICEDEDTDTYITYVYQDERPALHGDNRVLADQCEVYVNLYTPKNYDYFNKKKQIRDYLENSGFNVSSINTRVEDYGATKVRRTTFDCVYAEMRKKED